MTKRWVGLVVIAGMLLFTVAVYSALPERIPTHWNLRGEVDGWSSRLWGALLAPAVSLGLWLLMPVLRRVDPRRRNYERFDPTFRLVVNLLIAFFAVVHVLTLGAALGWPIDMTRTILVMVGLMFALLGNYLPRLKPNWWMGIRTPWTLDSDAVWRATHRLAGYTFVIGGLLGAASALLPERIAFPVALVCIMTGAFTPVIYSWIAYRREHRGEEGAA